MSEIPVQIMRRVTVGPFVIREGTFKFVNVTYATDTLAPEVIRFTEPDYSPEAELAAITRRVRERTKLPEAEIVLEGP